VEVVAAQMDLGELSLSPEAKKLGREPTWVRKPNMKI